MNLLAPITTKPWGNHIPQLKDVQGPTQEQQLDDGDIHTLKSNGLKMKLGVYY